MEAGWAAWQRTGISDIPPWDAHVYLHGGSFIYLVACPGTVSLLTALVNLTLPGADLAIAYKVLRSGADMVADSPEDAGFVALFRGAE